MKKHIIKNMLTSTMISVCLAATCIAQNSTNNDGLKSVIQHEKKSFSDETGRIYWNLELPVYLAISSNAEGNGSHKLKEVKGGQAGENSYPIHFDGHGVYHIRYIASESSSSQLEMAYVVYVDGKKPLSKISFLNAKKYMNEDNVYYGNNLTVNIVARDKMSGIDKIYYAINEGEFIAFTDDVSFPKETSYKFSSYAVDRVGNVENLNTFNFDVDLQSPDSKHEVLGNQLESVVSPKSLIKLSATDNLSGIKRIRFYFDNVTEGTYDGSIKLSKLSEGEHKLTYYSVDMVDNQEENNSYTFYLDKTPPEISTEVIGDSYQGTGKTFVSKRTKLEIIATDNKAGVETIYYTIDGKRQIKYVKPISVGDLSPGARNVAYKAIDKVNNETNGYKTDSRFSTLHFDSDAPKVSFEYIGAKFLNNDQIFITSRTKIKLMGSDLQSGIKVITYKIDDGTSINYSVPFIIIEEGSHSVGIEGIDNVNNKSDNKLTVIVDNTGPKISYHLNTDQIGTLEITNEDKRIPVYAKHAKLYLEATDQMVGMDKILYSLDNAPERLYTGPIATRKPGRWSVKVAAVDKLGNRQQLEPIEFVIQ